MKLLQLFFTGITFTLFSSVSYSQSVNYKDMMSDPNYNFYDVCAAADAYFETHDTGKGSGYVGYQRWKAENEGKFYPSGDRTLVSQNFAAKQYQQFVEGYSGNQRALYPNGWKELGPFEVNNITQGYNSGIGRVEAFWVNPNNDQHLYLGSRSGGFWKTSDGGTTWKNTTDYLIASGVNTIAVSPTNSDTVLINVRNGGNSATHGIYGSVDGGNTWTVTNFNPTNLGWGGLGNSDRIFVIKYHPTIPDLVFVGTSRGFFRSTDNLQTWTQLLNSTDVTEIEFHPTNPNIMYLYDDYYNSSYGNKILISNDAGLTFSSSATISGNGNYTGYISTTPTAPNNVYFASSNGVWKSTDEGQTFTFITNPNENCDGFAVSDLDSNAMIYGALDIQATVDGGSNFVEVTAWANTNPGTDYVHADVRTAECINGVFYVGTDGYLAKSSDNGNNWYRINNGTAIREFYASGVSQGSYDVFMAGSQDNGTSVKNSNGWIEWNGGDGMEAVVQSLNPDWMMGSWQFGTRSVTRDGGQTRQGTGNPESGSSEADWQAPLLQDPSNQMGIIHFAKKIYKSENFGDDWYELGNPSIGVIKVAAIAENNSEIMAAARNATMKITENNWITSRYVSNLPSYPISDIAFDPNKDSTIIVVNTKYENNGNKIYISKDLGLTWTNITYNLGNMPIRTVVIDHSDSSYIYVGAEIGVYVKSLNGNTWELYNTNLPNSTVKDLEIHYGSNTLKAATWGRGLWEYHLKGRESYPAILYTTITNPPSSIFPRAGYDQFVTAVISYDQNVKSAFVMWSNDSKDLGHVLPMSNISDSTWKTDDPIKNFGRGTDIFFKVFAVGQNNDTTETYRFQYKVQEGLIINGVEENARKGEVLIYPNPSNGAFSIQLPPNVDEALIEIFDISGKVVYSNKAAGSLVNVNVNLAKGSYVIMVTAKDLVSKQKLIIE